MSEPVTKEALDRVDNRLSNAIEENSRRIQKNCEQIIKLETLYGTLVKLPDTISSLEKTLLQVSHTMDTMGERISQINGNIQEQRDAIKELREENKKQDEDIESVDNKSKIDWASFITGNFWNILFKAAVTIAAAAVAWKTLSGA